MEFHEHASREAAELIDRIRAGWSDRSRRELQTFRDTIAASLKAAEAALGEPVDTEHLIGTLVERLTSAATAQADAAGRQAAQDAQKKIDAVQTELRTTTAEHAKATTALAEMRAQVEAMQAALKTASDQAIATRAELALVQDAHARAESARTAAEASASESASEYQTARRQLEELRKVLESTRGEFVRVTKQLETEASERAGLAGALSTAQTQLQAADAERRGLAKQLETALARLQELERAQATEQKAKREATAARDQAAADAKAQLEEARVQRDHLVAAASLPLERLLATYQKIGASKSIADVFNGVIEGMAHAFPRVALFRVKDSALEGIQQIGFEMDSDISNLVVPLNIDSALTKAVKSRQIQAFHAADLTSSARALFGGSPGFVLVLPIADDDRLRVVLYADDSGQTQTAFATQDHKVKYAQLLRWQAAPLISGFLKRQQALAAFREHAVRLVQEIERLYAADVKANQDAEMIQRRLDDHIRYARQVYAQLTEGKGAGVARLLEKHLETVSRAKNPSAFARDLGDALARAEGHEGSDLRPTASSNRS